MRIHPVSSPAPAGKLPLLGRSAFWPLFLLALAIAVLARTYLDGDGVEYLAMTHAFAEHASPAVRASDLDYLAQVLSRLGRPEAAAYTQVHDQLMLLPSAIPHYGFVRADSGSVYAIHFWLYSLLATPFYLLVTAAGATPTWCFALLNLSLVGASFWLLKRAVPAAFKEAALLFLALGTLYYLRWTGPEIMAACCAFCATIAMLRRDTSVAVLLCGLGAAQNPSLAFMIPVVIGHRLLAHRIPALCPLPSVRRKPGAEWAIGAAGLLAGLSSTIFYYLAVGVPSIIAIYSTSPDLISLRRAQSFVFDLNQGLVVGIPGLLAGFLLLAFQKLRRAEKHWWLNLLFVLLACGLIAGPTLAARNWNSGAAVMLRYAYWTAMPLVALIAVTLPALAPRARLMLVGLVLLGQLLAALATGWGSRHSSYLLHTPIARWTMAHAPSWYNPDPEIFFERGRRAEAVMDYTSTELYWDGSRPAKYLRHWSNTEASSGLCPAGYALSPASIVEVEGGWEYLNGPFACLPPSASTVPDRIAFSRDGIIAGTLVSGWWTPETAGTWTAGKKSVIHVAVPPGSEVLELRFVGIYFDRVRKTQVSINGQDLGALSLADGPIALPRTLRRSTALAITLVHPDAVSPAKLGQSADPRELAFHIKELQLRTRQFK